MSPGQAPALAGCQRGNLAVRLPTDGALGNRELVHRRGVQLNEDARNLTSLRARRRSPAVVEQPTGNRRRKNLCSRSQDFFVEVCDVYRTRTPFAK